MRRDLKYGQILGIDLSSINEEGVLRYIRTKIRKKKPFYITTPNPEQLVLAQKDPHFARILNLSDLRIPDGVGLSLAHWFLWGRPLKIIKGRELFGKIISLANKMGWRVCLLGGLLGGQGKVTKEAMEALKKNYQQLKIMAFDGPELDGVGKPLDDNNIKLQSKIIKDINNFKPDILFIGFGAPKQEKWFKLYSHNLEVIGSMSVGRTFEYFSGNFPLPPKWLSQLGLEWLYRLLTGSTSLRRIFNAVVVFPWMVFMTCFNSRKK